MLMSDVLFVWIEKELYITDMSCTNLLVNPRNLHNTKNVTFHVDLETNNADKIVFLNALSSLRG